jgi:hypothetical protein
LLRRSVRDSSCTAVKKGDDVDKQEFLEKGDDGALGVEIRLQDNWNNALVETNVAS